MRVYGALILLVLTITGAVAWEWLWHIGRGAHGPSVPSPSGIFVAQIHFLPEGSVVPYGQGVQVRYRFLPFWSTSTLVFAGYCKPGMRLHWRSGNELDVECIVAEGTPKMLPAPKGVVVTHVGGGS